MFAAVAMSLSSVSVVSNALRLNLVRIHDSSRDKAIRQKPEVPQDDGMQRTMKIKGMMCEHCEARVRNALEALPEVAQAEVSHKKGTAVVSLNAGIENEKLKQAVEEQMYQVLSIR